MNARAALIWIGTTAVAFGLGWWAAHPPAIDPEAMGASLEEALELENPLWRARQLSRLFEGLTPENIDDAMEVIEAKPRLSDGDLHLLMYAWTRFDPEGAFERARSSKQQLMRRRGTAAATYYWAVDNPKAALYWVETTEDEAFREYLTEYLVSGWALSSERDSAAAYIARLPRSRLRQIQTSFIMSEYMKEGPEAVIEWAESLSDDISEGYRHEVFQRAANQIAVRDPELAARWITGHLGENYARATIRPIVKEWIKRDPENAMEWLVSLPASKQRNRVTFFAFRRWYDADPSGARAWIEAEAFEPAHDPALDGYARRLSKVSPKKAVDWAELIQDPARREKSLVVVGQNWMRKKPDAARAWLAESDLSESSRSAVLNPPAIDTDTEDEDDELDREEDEFAEVP
jgi:hypothetical protein